VLEVDKRDTYPARMDLRAMFAPQEYVVRLYVIRARNLVRTSSAVVPLA
jgi:hypothetical protein